MWSRILGVLIVLLVVSYLVQMLFPRTRGKGRRQSSGQYLMWDIAPLVGFLGAVVLALSLVEAMRQTVLVAWGGGAALGLVAGLSMWVALAYTRLGSFETTTRPPAKKRGFLAGLLHHLRTVGPPLVIGLVVLNVAVRLVGAVLEVFLAGALGVIVVAAAIVVFASGRRLDHS